MVGSEYIPSVGETVWISPTIKGEYQLPWSGKVVSVNRNKIRVISEDNKKVDVLSKDIIKPLNPNDIQTVDDMIELSDLQEHSILRNIYLRYQKNIIYTYAGGILVAINPYKQLDIYSDKAINLYQGKRLVESKPHIFAVAAQALANLKRHLQNQCIVISGETGSGKTESTKLILNFLATCCSKSDIGNKIVQANPILEAFGNAKTTMNDNSSRFGKYIDISFRHDGTIRSACIQHYLLEKSRIKSQNIGDRNYHIFYCLLAGLPQALKDKLQVTQAKDYFYLTQGMTTGYEEHNKKEEFIILKNAFSTLNFTEKEKWSIFQILAAILHIGNFVYKSVPKGNDEETQILRNIHFQLATSILGLNQEHFTEALTCKTILVEGTKVVSELTIEQAKRSRDAFAMSLYNHLFSYILMTINKSISDHKVSRAYFSIGILDIFGFENFASNSFEQFCINYANEHLQQYFVNHIFKYEQEEYLTEGIKWEPLTYEDNNEVLKLMGSNKMSILMILDEQTRFPKGSDKGMLLKCDQNHSGNKYYSKSKSEVTLKFGVKHYAGLVSYSVEGFIEKNMNTLSLEWREIVQESSNPFLKDLFVKELNSTGKSQTPTLAGQYRQSLDSLMTALSNGMPFFVRCIKPNSLKEPNVFDRKLVCQQLRYSGMMATAKIRQTGYPIRYTYVQFVLRYRMLVPTSPPLNKIKDMKETTKIVCEKYLEKNEYQFGKTKVFLKIPDEKLENIRDKIFTKSAIIIQKHFRASRHRLRFMRMKKAAITIQRYWRGYKPREEYLKVQRGYLRLQAVLRSRQLKHNYNKMRSQIIKLQGCCKGYLKRKEIAALKKAKNNRISVPVPKPRKSSNPEMWLDNYITDIFDSAVEEKIDHITSDIDYLKPVSKESINDILNKPGVMNFQKYASANFMGNINCRFSKKVLDQPLLEHTSPGDQMAATVLWVTIMRFMHDLDENASWTKGPKPKTRKSIMSQLHATISKNFLHSKEFLKILNAMKEEEKNVVSEKLEFGKKKLINLTLVHRNKLRQEVMRAKMETEALKNSYQEWVLGPPTSLLEKLYFIIGHGILRPNLRDEIYCQLCKQLTENPDPISCMYGWILLSLCTSCFPPSPKLAPTLLHFLARSNNMLGSLRKLQRTLENGPRSQPPSAFELSAFKSQQKMFIDVFLLDDSAVNLEVDSASTAKEIITAVSKNKNMDDIFGFSIFVSMCGQVVSLESNNWFLMDGVSQCEMKANDTGLPEITAPWTVVFRREMFPPWPIAETDPTSIDLTYFQIFKGISLGEYRCSQECELSLLVAQHYYILYGKRLLPEILNTLIKEVIPVPLLKRKHSNWAKLVTDVFEKSYFVHQKIPEDFVRIDVVNFAKKKWPLLFSRYYEVVQLSGFYLGSSDLLLVVNSYGIFIVTNSTEIIFKLRYIEIASIEYVAGPTQDCDQIHLYTIRQHRYIFKSHHSKLICDFVNSILDELLLRSKYAVAIDDYSPPDDSFLRLTCGDLVILNDVTMDEKWMRGHHVDSGHVGEFPKKLVRILPCTEKPPNHVLYICTEVKKPNDYHTKGKSHTLLVKKHTLEGYASRYFRTEQYKLKCQKGDELWKFSSNKLWSPLHRSLSTLSHIVTPMFNAILHYMGDKAQIGQKRFTRTIFEPPLQHEVLQDELYCMLMKQMTDNPSLMSIELGWELMLLATCLFPPSSILLRDLEEWLDTRPCEMSCKCLQRINTLKYTKSRRYSHHYLEVVAIQERLPILHRVIFPNSMEHMFEADSLMTVNDLVENISDWLGLLSFEGFSLIVVFEDTAISLNPNLYLFDALLYACQFPRTAIDNETPQYSYDLMFVKKLWMNTYAGMDKTADLVCHYYQELPKYLAGSHNCTAQDAMYLGALIFIAENNDFTPNDPYKEILGKLQHLVPAQLVHGLAPSEWLDGIMSGYEQNKDLKSDDAKIKFLKMTQNWPNFGSAFFSVHSSSSMQDEQMTLVVNRNGICLVHPFTQEILTCYNYAEIIGCKYTDFFFNLTVPNRTYTWYTRAANKIADLVNSYIDAFDNKYLIT